MDIAALATWITAAAVGLYLLSIWLIEYDKEFQRVAATRLPIFVLVCHVLFAAGGLIVWAAYLLLRTKDLAWAAVVALVLAATFGSTMTIRWISVYRATRALRRAADGSAAVQPTVSTIWPGNAMQPAVYGAPTGQASQFAGISQTADIGPPERNFPLTVVIGHGLFAVTTLALVLLTALGIAW